MTKTIDITNQEFGNLTAIKFIKKVIRNNKKNYRHFWLFECKCGRNKVIDKSNVIGGHTKSCSCLRLRKEERSPSWKGGKVGYVALHEWLRKKMPKPSKCALCKISSKNLEIACKNRNYIRDTANYFWLCISCHRKYDFTEETRRKLRLSHLGKKCPYSWVPIVQLNQYSNRVNNYNSVTEASKMTKISRESITNCLTGRSKTAGGFFWKYSRKNND